MPSPISIGPDANRTGMALKLRWRTATYTVFVGFAVRTHKTTLTLPLTCPPNPKEEPRYGSQSPVLLSLRSGEEPPPTPPPEPPDEPTGVTPPADGRGSGPPGSTASTEDRSWRLEFGISRSTDTTEGVTPPADSSGKDKPPT